jgi:hypothetical protein
MQRRQDQILGAALTNQSAIDEEIKGIKNPRIADVIRFSIFCRQKNTKTEIYRSIIYPVLYECGTRFITLRDKRGLRVFENTTLRKKFGLKREEVTEEWRKLQNEELYDIVLLTKFY